jgi:SAM-dependent methyltransferase
MSFPGHEQFWSARYRDAGDDYLFGTAPNRFLAAHAGVFEAGNSALSIADGEGRNAVWLAEQGLAVTATEISPVALEKARKLAAGRHVEVDFVLADVLAPEWPPAHYESAYDFGIGIFIQFAAPGERERLFTGLKRAVRPGGLVLVQGYTPKQLEYRTGGPPAVENLYTPEMLRDLFSDFEILELRAHEEVLDEGSAHKGHSALIDLVARRPLR